MKTLTALFTAATLALTAGLAQADVRVDEIPQLVKDGKIKPLEDLNRIALDLHPGATITKTELDNHFNGYEYEYEYEIELRDAKNVEWDVDIDASNGKVLKNKQDT
ncbi:MAG: PepSY domain-containing protein [Pseudomonas sp.]